MPATAGFFLPCSGDEVVCVSLRRVNRPTAERAQHGLRQLGEAGLGGKQFATDAAGHGDHLQALMALRPYMPGFDSSIPYGRKRMAVFKSFRINLQTIHPAVADNDA